MCFRNGLPLAIPSQHHFGSPLRSHYGNVETKGRIKEVYPAFMSIVVTSCSEVIKLFFMLILTEHEISLGHKTKNTNN